MIQRALVTGHKGFVGAAIHSRLKSHGWHVDGCDIKDGAFADCRLVFADELKVPYDLIVHCAAVVGGIDTRVADPLGITENFALDSDMFRWAARGNARRVVYFSSCAAYPTHLQVPGRLGRESDIDVEGETLGNPDITYGLAKLVGEALAVYARKAGVAVHVLRPFSGYGPTQDRTYPFPSFLDRAARREDPFEIWGNGTAVRDFVHLDDVVGTVLAVIEQDYQEPLNIGWGRATSFNDLARLFAEAVGYDPAFKHRPAMPAGPQWRVADTTKLLAVYQPKITLEEGIKRALA